MSIHTDKSASAWQAYLAGLPSVAPPASLRERMLEARETHSQRRRRWWRAGSLAAGIVIALVGVSLWTHENGPADQSSTRFVQAVSDEIPAVVSGDTRLIQLDDAIAQAYASDLSEGELQSLWQARASLLIQQEEAPSALLVQL